MNFKEWFLTQEWRGQRGQWSRTGSTDNRKTGGRPKGTWVGGNPRYSGGDPRNHPEDSRTFVKNQTRKDIEAN